MASKLLLPAATRLVHIGPHKTGTTTVQFAFHARRRELARQGVHYAGPNSQPAFAVYAVLGRTPAHAKRSPIRRWRKLVREIEAAGDARVVVSSESFSEADEPAIRRIVGDLDPTRVHVVVTLRPLAAILPSQWQQSVQSGLTLDYQAWLRMVFDEPESAEAVAFWHRHRHDDLIGRWAAVVGPERLTVIVADDRDHTALLRVFEALVGLRPGTLEPQAKRTNRSMTRPQVELLRAINAAFDGAEIGPKVRHDLVDRGIAAMAMRRSVRPDEPGIQTPGWVLERAAVVAREIVAGIEAADVRVIGDLRRLTAVPSSRPASPVDPGSMEAGVWPEVAASAGLGILLASGAVRDRGLDPGIDGVSTPQLRRVFAQRVRGAAAVRLPAAGALGRRLRRWRGRD